MAILALEKEIHWTEKTGVEIKTIGKDENFSNKPLKCWLPINLPWCLSMKLLRLIYLGLRTEGL